jgi:hypothetical protein
MNPQDRQVDTARARQRLRELHKARHSRDPAQLVLPDVATYLRTSLSWLQAHSLPSTPKSCRHGCPGIDACRSNCRDMNPSLRRAILKFFAEWDAGLIRKVYLGDTWQLVSWGGATPAAQLGAADAAPAPPGRALHLVIDRESLKLRFK